MAFHCLKLYDGWAWPPIVCRPHWLNPDNEIKGQVIPYKMIINDNYSILEYGVLYDRQVWPRQ